MSKLVVVPTPVGNLDDITFRAIQALKDADVVLAEDTRTTSLLFQKFDIHTRLVAYHIHNEHKIVDQIVLEIETGKTYALVSDAGTPAISDPGYLLIRACIQKDIEVTCLPGATAFVPAVVMSGFPCEKFVYEGFLPQKKGRETRIKAIADEERTVVFYESPHRLLKCLEQFDKLIDPERQIAACREISKKFEEVVRGNCKELLKHFTENPIKGEFVLVIEGKKIAKEISRSKRSKHHRKEEEE